jgi:hypothetical protein
MTAVKNYGFICLIHYPFILVHECFIEAAIGVELQDSEQFFVRVLRLYRLNGGFYFGGRMGEVAVDDGAVLLSQQFQPLGRTGKRKAIGLL